MSKSISELAMFWAGRSGCFEAATANLLSNPSEENIQYWTTRMAEWNQEQADFFAEDTVPEEEMPVIKSSTYYPA